jgi:anti-sigma28 factor (negative regulator of flagellin synthesis)
MRIDEIQVQVSRGEYRVDKDAVAAAILKRMLQVRRPPARPKTPPQA